MPVPDETQSCSDNALLFQTPVRLADIAAHAGVRLRLDADRPLSELEERFAALPILPGVLITRAGALLAIISRGALHQALCRPFHREIYLRRPIANLLETWRHEPLTLDARLELAQAIDAALARSATERYEPIAVREADGGICLLDLFPLLSRQCELLAQSFGQLHLKHQQLIAAQQERQQAHERLAELSRQAGMAEIASGVLHNVGNVLNSVVVSAALLAERLRGPRYERLRQAVELLPEAPDALLRFIADDVRGQRLPGYLRKLSEAFTLDQRDMLAELDRLSASIEHIKQIVRAQQRNAKVSVACAEFDLVDVLEDAVRLNALSLERHRIQIERDYAVRPHLRTDKHVVLQILVNVISNARTAVKPNAADNRRIRLGLHSLVVGGQEGVRVSVTDNGVGIAPDHLTKIFNHGFTTRQDGNGFGLHNSANHAHMIGGVLTAHSAGLGRGATFDLDLPLTFVQSQAA